MGTRCPSIKESADSTDFKKINCCNVNSVDTMCELSLLLVLFSALRGFSPGSLVFSSPQKPTFPNSNSTSNQADEGPQSGCATSKSLFIYLSFIKHIS